MLCKTRPEYFQLWEGGKGPCIGKIRKAPIGLGDFVALVIWLATFGKLRPWPGCGCHKRKAWLNRIVVWGWWRK